MRITPRRPPMGDATYKMASSSNAIPCGPPRAAAPGEDGLAVTILPDANYSAAAADGSRHVQIAVLIECHSLRAAQSSVEDLDLAVVRNAVYAIEAGRGGAGNVEVPIGSESEVICGHRGFERGEDEDLAI